MSTSRIPHVKPSDEPLYGSRRRVAFVTGAARGIGQAIALRLAKDGLDIVANDLKLEALGDTKNKVEGLGAKCFVVSGDVSDEKRVEKMIDEAVKEMGYLDVFIANAGIEMVSPILDMSTEQLERVLSVNVRGVHLCYKYAARHMIKQGTGGKLIAAASLAGFKGSSLTSAYVASKFAVRGYNMTAALELAKFGITCNCYAPGFINTDMTAHKSNGALDTKAHSIMMGAMKLAPLKRMGEPEDVSNLVSFLVSRNSDYITGQTMPVGGGMHML